MINRKVRLITLLLSILLLLSACSPATTGPSPSAAAPTATKAAKNSVLVALKTEPSSLDPHNVNMVTAYTIGNLIFDRLFNMTSDNKIVPQLATKWNWVDDTTLRVEIRKDVSFHNGDKLTADDVVYSLQRACSSSSSAATMNMFDGPKIKKVDDYTVDIKTKSAYPNAITILTHCRASIVCKGAIEKMGADAYGRTPVGSGKFSAVSWAPGDRLVLTRNDKYWGDKPTYKDLTFRFIAEDASRSIELETGAVDIAFNVSPNDVERLKKNKDVNIQIGPSTTINQFVINTVNFDLLKDVRVRKAMHMALDMDAICKTAYKGYATVAKSLYPEGTFGYKESTTKYDPEGAKALLKEAGFDTSKVITLNLAQDQQAQDVSEMAANMWKAIGLNVKVEVIDRATLVTNNASGKTLMCITTVTGIGANPENPLLQWEKPSSGFHNDKDLYAKISAAKGILDDAKRAAAYQDIEQTCWDMNVVIPISIASVVYGARANVKGLSCDAANMPDLSLITFA